MNAAPLFAQQSHDAADITLMLIFLSLVIALPVAGYVMMVIDIRAYLRSLRRAMIVVRNHLTGLPSWALQHTPGCIRSLGLEMPCTEAQVKHAYRRLAEELHPDRGGDQRRFMLLQKQYEEALTFLRELEAEKTQAGEPGEPQA